MLDVTAYPTAVLVQGEDDGDLNEDLLDQQEDDGHFPYIRVTTGDFPERADGLVGGIYRVPKEGTVGFSAGSYVAYAHWRTVITRAVWSVDSLKLQLAGLTGEGPRFRFEDYVTQPFYALIHFSDCEGVIGPRTAAQLAADFAAHADVARSWWPASDQDRAYRLYENFRRAFDVAAGNGMVQFH